MKQRVQLTGVFGLVAGLILGIEIVRGHRLETVLERMSWVLLAGGAVMTAAPLVRKWFVRSGSERKIGPASAPAGKEQPGPQPGVKV